MWVGPKSKVSKDPDSGKGRGKWGPHRQFQTAPRRTRYGMGMDITWLTDERDPRTARIAVGGGIWNVDNMAKVAEAGITHIIDMQIEFDDRELVGEHDIAVMWNGTEDDFEPKPASLFRCGVDFALAALGKADTKLFIHCAAGVHRAPMMALAVLGAMEWDIEDAMRLIEEKRPVADFADVYVESVRQFLAKSRDSGRAGGTGSESRNPHSSRKERG